MFEKIAQVAERAAESASRREFLGRFGRASAGLAAALGAVVVSAAAARAAGHQCKECGYTCADGTKKWLIGGRKCAATLDGCKLTFETNIGCV
jgi:uncharacterized ferredoxin-like protein